VAALAYAGFLLHLFPSPGDVDVTTLVSELESDGELGATLRALDVTSAVLTLPLVPFIARALPRGPWRPVAVWSLAVFALAGIPAGAIRLPPCADENPADCARTADQVQGFLHDGLSIVSTVAIIACAAACAMAVRGTGPRWLARAGWITVAVQVVTGAVLGVAEVRGPEALGGVFQRLEILGISAWIVCLAVYAATDGVRAPRGLRAAAPGAA
jgi:hypothetical protein